VNRISSHRWSYLPSASREKSSRIPLFVWMFLLLLLKMSLLRYFMYGNLGASDLASDAASLIVLLSIIELITPRRWKGIFYWPINAIFSVMLFAAALYFEHFNAVPTYTALYSLNQVTQIRSSVEATIQWSNYWFFADILAAALLWLFWKMRRYQTPISKSLNKKVLLAMLMGGLILCARMIQVGLPIQNELASAQKVGFLNYQVSSAIKTAKDNSVAVMGNMSDIADQVRELQSTYAYSDKSGQAPAFFGAAKGKNVIILQLEAFQNFPLHLSVDGKEVTPVLNQLAAGGLYFPNVFQQIGQGNTSDAEFISNTSLYPTGKIAMSTGYGDRQLPSMPQLLQKRNYESNTFHVNDVTFWDRDKLYAAIGFDHYYDKPSYKSDNFNSFGASDEELYRVGVEKLSETAAKGKPFYAQFVTASSHHPFKVPKDRRKIELPASYEDTVLGDYLYAVNYTDYAIGTLIERLKESGLWENTVIAVYGDHSGLPATPSDAEQVSEQLGIPYDSQVSKFNIPLIIHLPGSSGAELQGKVIEQVGGQLDIMPTLANLLGVSLSEEEFTAFGHDLLNVDHNILGMRYYLPTGSFFNNDILYIPGKDFEDGTAISLKTHEPITDLTPYRADYDYVLKLMELSDQYVHSLPKR